MTPRQDYRPAPWSLNSIAVTAAGIVLMAAPVFLWIAWTPALFVGALALVGFAGFIATVFGPSFVQKEAAWDAAQARTHEAGHAQNAPSAQRE